MTKINKDITLGEIASKYPKAVEIADILKAWIKKGDFLITEPVAPIPSTESGYKFRPLNERPIV